MKHRVSVALACHNGEECILEQINSILVNLDEDDELVISDDGSTDKTIAIVKKAAKNDKRIRLVHSLKKGVTANFMNAMMNCKGDYIFLSDQDDIWFDNKVKTIVPLLANHDLVVHDCIVTNTVTSSILYSSFFEFRKSGPGVGKNLLKNTYIGCCMAFSRKLMKKVLPIPGDIPMHDQWIGILNDIFYKNTLFLKKPLIFYRRHNNNVSSFNHYPINKMIKARVILLKELGYKLCK